MIARLVGLALLLAPGAAWACPSCLSSAYGDRTFNWAYLGLLLMPFVVALLIVGTLAARYYAARRADRMSESSGRAPAGPAQLVPHEENSL